MYLFGYNEYNLFPVYLTGEAQKKLDELEDQKSRLDSDIKEWRDKCTDKQKDINNMKEELAQQDRLEKVAC